MTSSRQSTDPLTVPAPGAELGSNPHLIGLPSKPGFAPARLLNMMREAIARTGLDLSGMTILTEAATGAYCVTPLIAALANADRVYALTRQSRYGAVAEVASCTHALASLAGIDDRIEVMEKLDSRIIGGVDLVTNSGHLRPITGSLIAHLPQRSVIALMFEAWEFRAEDIDLAACRERGVAIAGVNERHPTVDVFSYLGPLCVHMLHEAGVAVYGSRIALLCDNEFGPSIVASLLGLGAHVVSCADATKLSPDRWDAVVVALQPAAEPRIDAVAAAHLARVAPTAVIAQLWGDIDRAALSAAMGAVAWPPDAPAPGHMGVLLSAIGPEPIVRLQTGGLAAAEWVFRGKAVEPGGIAQLV